MKCAFVIMLCDAILNVHCLATCSALNEMYKTCQSLPTETPAKGRACPKVYVCYYSKFFDINSKPSGLRKIVGNF